jgi:hypothetical protein
VRLFYHGRPVARRERRGRWHLIASFRLPPDRHSELRLIAIGHGGKDAAFSGVL